MDLLTHSATGAFIGWALPRRLAGPGATPLVITGALLPDVDTVVELFVGPRSAFAHRGFTHSLFGVAVLAPLVALVALRFSKERRFVRLVALIATGMLSHVLLDLPTPMGVMLFFPSRNHVHLDFLGYFDWTLFTVALCVLLAAWTYANRGAAVRRGILSAVLLSALSWWLFTEWPTLAFSFAATVEEATEEPLRTVYPVGSRRSTPGCLGRVCAKGLGFSAEPGSVWPHRHWRPLHLSRFLCDGPTDRTQPNAGVHARAGDCGVEAGRESDGILFTRGASPLDGTGTCAGRSLRGPDHPFRRSEPNVHAVSEQYR